MTHHVTPSHRSATTDSLPSVKQWPLARLHLAACKMSAARQSCRHTQLSIGTSANLVTANMQRAKCFRCQVVNRLNCVVPNPKQKASMSLALSSVSDITVRPILIDTAPVNTHPLLPSKHLCAKHRNAVPNCGRYHTIFNRLIADLRPSAKRYFVPSRHNKYLKR